MGIYCQQVWSTRSARNYILYLIISQTMNSFKNNNFQEVVFDFSAPNLTNGPSTTMFHFQGSEISWPTDNALLLHMDFWLYEPFFSVLEQYSSIRVSWRQRRTKAKDLTEWPFGK